METPNNKDQKFLLEVQDYISVWIEQFIADRKSQNLSQKTIRFYTVNLGKFGEYCDSNSLKTIQQLTPQFIREFLLHLEQKGLNTGGQSAYYRSIKAFLRWFWEEVEPDFQNPINKVKAPKTQLVPMEGVTPEQVETLISFCHKDTYTGERDKAVLMLMFDTGLRAQEACDIRLENVDILKCSLSVVGKGRKFRNVFFGTETRKQLRRYSRYSRNSEYLFSSQTGEKMTYNTIRQILRRLCEQAGIKEISLHDFRRGFALEALKNGTDLLSISRIMGHSDLSLLQRYINQSRRDLEDKYRSSVDLMHERNR